jgi:hypothetical protein
MRINVAKIRHALQFTANRCDPDNPEYRHRIGQLHGERDFGATIIDVVDNTTQHQLLQDALTECQKFGIDEIYDYQDV